MGVQSLGGQAGRNATRQLPHILTSIVTELAQAACLCPAARTDFAACHDCLRSVFGDAAAAAAMDETAGRYWYDCEQFDHFDNATLAYPSTTRAAPPTFPTTAALPPSAGYVAGGAACGDACDGVRARAAQCGATPLDAAELSEWRQLGTRTSHRRGAAAAQPLGGRVRVHHRGAPPAAGLLPVCAAADAAVAGAGVLLRLRVRNVRLLEPVGSPDPADDGRDLVGSPERHGNGRVVVADAEWGGKSWVR